MQSENIQKHICWGDDQPTEYWAEIVQCSKANRQAISDCLANGAENEQG